MKEIYKWQMEKRLKYFRKIHLYKQIYLVSAYAKKSDEGRFYFNLHNILHYPLTFIFIPVKVIDWSGGNE